MINKLNHDLERVTMGYEKVEDLRGTVQDMSVMLNAANVAIKALLRNSPGSVAMLTQYLNNTMEVSNPIPITPEEREMFCRQIQGLLPPA